MRRISLAVALISAVAAAGCGGGGKPSAAAGNRGTAGVDFDVKVNNQGPGSVSDGTNTCAPDTTCTWTYASGTTVVLSATAAGTNYFNGFFGDCNGMSCSLSGDASKYVVVFFSATPQSHPNFNDGVVHGAAVAAGVLNCYSCHGAQGQGQGLAPSCASCHGGGGGPIASNVENCQGCHKTGALSAALKHAVAGKVVTTATTPVVATNGLDLEFTVNVKVDGVANNNMLAKTPSVHRFAYVTAREAATVVNAFERFTVAVSTAGSAGYTIASTGNGNYLVTIVGGVATVAAQSLPQTTFAVHLADQVATASVYPANTNWASAVTHYNGPARDLVGDAACTACHGDQVFRHREASNELHHGANPYGVSACVVCHTRYGSTSRGMGGDRLTAYVHGVHASHDMPARAITANLDPDGAGPLTPVPFTATKDAGVYARNDSIRFVTGSTTTAEISSPFSVGFPTYMGNCSVCHDTDARLTAVMSKPVSASTCMSCHDNFEGFPNTKTGGVLAGVHASVVLPVAGTPTANACAACHNGTIAKATVGEYHGTRQNVYTDRNGLLFGGKDQSIELGKRVALKIDSVSYDTVTPTNLIVKWSATLDGSPVDPCNTNVATGPVFMGLAANAATGQSASNMSILQAYAQGNDWVNAGVGTSPGQPIATGSLSATAASSGTVGATTCDSNVATTVVTAATTTATKGGIALQGKPQMTFTSGAYTRVVQLRSTSPIREFVVGSGAAPAKVRRQIVSNDKCLACHPGSLYQHGGNRVDSVDLCVTCHNPASNEKSVRVGMGVDATEAYDGKPGQTYDLRYMLHAIHSAGEKDGLLVFYRTNGIYAFGSENSIANIPNWPGAGSFKPYGSGANEPVRTHNEIVVHYPRPLNDCGACHVNGSENAFGDQANQMAVTVHDSGATQAFNETTPVYNGAANGNQLDDVLVGATAASCVSCHQSVVEKTFLTSHTAQWGWTPAVFPLGRQTLIDFVTAP
jgi:OmcA/MtrC family decaheme c-type cytochrome